MGPRLQACVATRLRLCHGGVLPQPQFMEEGDWIAMTGVPLTAAEGTTAEGETATDAEGGGADAPRDDTHETEGVARQNAGSCKVPGLGGH
jgi:hypothetical protein